MKLRHLPLICLGLLGGAALAAQEGAGQPESTVAQRRASANNLKQIGLALHNYHDANGKFPPAAICDKQGKPLLSWRVAILPYIEQDNLFKQFKLDEPWDSEHNKPMSATVVKLFTLPNVKGEAPGTTHYRVFVGGGALFEPKDGVRLPDVKDGTSNTIMVVEAKDGVPWAKPDELTYDPKKVPEVGYFKDGFNALFADGAVRWIKRGIDPKTLHALITRAGGEVIQPPSR
jgi:hypothetical protein